jgi:uncharacterized protein (DUF2249 family)
MTVETSPVALATSRADAEAAEAVREHHAEMAGTLTVRTRTLMEAVAARDPGAAEDARTALVAWCETELVPHAVAEERAMYPAAQRLPQARLLVEAMVAEHLVIIALVSELAEADEPVRAAAAARALQVTFETHLAKENEQVLPLLLQAPGVSVAELLGGMHELLGGHDDDRHHGGVAAAWPGEEHRDGHRCACGEGEVPGFPELDARSVPHAIRHATIFGALDAVAPGQGLVLVAPHDPLPLLSQLEERSPGAFEVDYLQRGPEAWRLVFLRRSAA